MNSKDFQKNALKTESIPEEFTISYDAMVATMNIAVEAGNAVDVIKKALYYGKPIDSEKYTNTLRALSVAALEMRALVTQGNVVSGHTAVDKDVEKDVRVLHGALGMFTEAGEMVSCIRKYALNMDVTPEMDEVNFREEMGDSDWYKAILLDALGVTEEEIRAKVIAKLKERYADKFTAEEAINRDVDAEREILERNEHLLFAEPVAAVEEAA